MTRRARRRAFAEAPPLLRRSDAARRRTRRYLIARDGLACNRCGEPISGEVPSIGHRLAVALGGSDHASNLALEHLACNKLGGASPAGGPGFFPGDRSYRQSSAARNGAQSDTVRRVRIRIGVMPPDPTE
jgi:hypothetical protein